MPNNPVQIVLNHEDFLRAPDPRKPGPNKDFFDGDDAGFRRHKQMLLDKIEEIVSRIKGSSYGPAAYLRVQMRTEALAKSYRPNRCLFTSDLFPCVGADGIGTIYFRAPLIYLNRLSQRINAAEPRVEVKVSRHTGRPYKATTRARSEVGAIEAIDIAPPEDKRRFSTAAALQMLRDPYTVSGYHVELFETPSDQVIADDPLGRLALRRSLEQVLLSLGAGARTFLAPDVGRTPVLELQLTKSEDPPLIENRLRLASTDLALSPTPAAMDLSVERHDTALAALAQHPLVRAIHPPVQLRLVDAELPLEYGVPFQIPRPSANATYPVVGVIDSGVATVLDAWIVDRFDYLNDDEFDAVHGTGVAGLIAVGQSANDHAVTPEPTGCQIYDAALFPKGAFYDHYPNGFTDFLEELEQAVSEARESHAIRIFNLSVNAVSEVEAHRYSIYAARLDRIADTYDVIFVNSVGNLAHGEVRAPWPKRPAEAVRYFAGRTQPDTIFKPSESVRGVSVGALNPPSTSQVEGAPTTYTRRGPGLQVGVKPDVAAYGGAGAIKPGESTGLISINVEGKKTDVVGTSFAAPLVARSLAGLDVATQGGLETEALKAMILHHTEMPHPLTRQGMKDLARQFAGFGQPNSVADMLQTDDHQITLVFQSRLTVGERKPAILFFPFEWPSSLVEPNGACSGIARMTLVYSPPLDPAFGAEFVRVNLEASLLQRQPNIRQDGRASYTNQIAARYLPKSTGLGVPEKALIDHGLKWWPCKQYGSSFVSRGEFSSWRLEVTSLVRAEAEFPPEGVPFAVILTIEDPEGRRPVFQEMRQALQASPARAVDIRTATRVRPRGR